MDEDGHLAHEFYEERRGKMRRLKKNLVPQVMFIENTLCL